MILTEIVVGTETELTEATGAEAPLETVLCIALKGIRGRSLIIKRTIQDGERTMVGEAEGLEVGAELGERFGTAICIFEAAASKDSHSASSVPDSA